VHPVKDFAFIETNGRVPQEVNLFGSHLLRQATDDADPFCLINEFVSIMNAGSDEVVNGQELTRREAAKDKF